MKRKRPASEGRQDLDKASTTNGNGNGNGKRKVEFAGEVEEAGMAKKAKTAIAVDG